MKHIPLSIPLSKSENTFPIGQYKTFMGYNMTQLSYYLAGLWESDGHVDCRRGFLLKPSIHITMHGNDLPFAKFLNDLHSAFTNGNVGRVSSYKKANAVVWSISSYEGLVWWVQNVGPVLRTPKRQSMCSVAESLSGGTRLARKGKPSYNLHLKKHPSHENLASNAWLSVISGDGCFYVYVTAGETHRAASCVFELKQVQTYIPRY